MKFLTQKFLSERKELEKAILEKLNQPEIKQDTSKEKYQEYLDQKKKDLDKNLSIEQKQNFYNIVVKVNGLTKSFKNHKSEKIKITADHIHNTFREFGFDSKISIKAEIKKP